METHLDMCPDCRVISIAPIAISGAALENLPPLPVTDLVHDYARATIESGKQQEPVPTKPANPNTILRASLVEYVGGDIDAVK